MVVGGCQNAGFPMAQKMRCCLFRFPAGGISPASVNVNIHKARTHIRTLGVNDLRALGNLQILPEGHNTPIHDEQFSIKENSAFQHQIGIDNGRFHNQLPFSKDGSFPRSA